MIAKARENEFSCKSNVTITSHMTVLNMEAALISEIDFYQALTKRNFFQDFLISFIIRNGGQSF